MEGFFCTGKIVVCLKQVGTADRFRERLNMEVKTSTSWSALPLRTRPGMPSGPDDFRGFTFLKALLTSSVVSDRVHWSWSSADPYRGDGVARLKPSVEAIELVWERGGRLGISTIPPFVISDGSQSTPHVSGVGAVVVRLQFVSVGSFGISDGFPQVISGLPQILQVPRAKGRGPGSELVPYIINALGDVGRVRVCVFINVSIICQSGFKTDLKSNNGFLTPSLKNRFILF